MELENVRKLLTVIALADAKPDDSEELEALRNISLALIHIADAIAQMQKKLSRGDHRPPLVTKSEPGREGEAAAHVPFALRGDT